MEALAAVGCEIDEFGCAADLDEQGAGEAAEISGWSLASVLPAASSAAAPDAKVGARHNRGVETV